MNDLSLPRVPTGSYIKRKSGEVAVFCEDKLKLRNATPDIQHEIAQVRDNNVHDTDTEIQHRRCTACARLGCYRRERALFE